MKSNTTILLQTTQQIAGAPEAQAPFGGVAQTPRNVGQQTPAYGSQTPAYGVGAQTPMYGSQVHEALFILKVFLH